jgi:hypothetical protein
MEGVLRLVVLLLTAAVCLLAEVSDGLAQQVPFHRLPSEMLDVAPPTARVRGEPGTMTVLSRPCRTEPPASIRRYIVDIAVQEWAFFGFPVIDETDPQSWVRPRGRRPPGSVSGQSGPPAPPRLSSRQIEEATRVAGSIAGYWAATSEGAWVVDRQNDAWNGPAGPGARWVQPWSAAFVSWVMCEAGLGTASRFQRTIAHHVYIDQAIRARDGGAPQAAFVAYDAGEAVIEPGDLLCTGQRPVYRTIADRRRQMGVGARTHCDIVVQVDAARGHLLAIGGNVRGTVGLKRIPVAGGAGRPLRPLDRSHVEGARSTFAHLKLRAESIDAAALHASPTIKAIVCAFDAPVPATLTVPALRATGVTPDRC